MVVNGLANAMSGLNAKQLEAYISSKKLNVAQASLAMRQNGVSRATRMQILQNLGLIQSNGKLKISLKSITAGLWETTKAWAMSPLGMATIAAVGIFAIVKIVDLLTTSLEESREALANLKEEYTDNENELTTLNDELQTTINRINELQGKDSLTFTEAEELENLIRQNTELERQIALLNTIQAQTKKKMLRTFVQTMEIDLDKSQEYAQNPGGFMGQYSLASENYVPTNSNTDIVDTMSEKDFVNAVLMRRAEVTKALSGSLTDSERKYYDELLVSIDEYLTRKSQEFADAADGISYVSNPTTSDEKAVNEWIDFINDFNDKMMIAMNQPKARENALNRLIFGGFSNATSELQNLGKQGQVTAKHLEDSRYDAFIQKCIDLGIITADDEEGLAFLALGFNSLANAEGEAVSSTNVTISVLEKLEAAIEKVNSAADAGQSAISTLSSALGELRSGALGLEDVINLLQEFPELAPYVDLDADNFGNLGGGLIAAIQNAYEQTEIELQALKLSGDLSEEASAAVDKMRIAMKRLADESIASATPALDDFSKSLSKIEDTHSGFGILSNIYADVKDAGDFDWSSILNNDDFTKTFGGLGDAYTDFVHTITNSSGDIDACQDAFDNLASAYIKDSDALKSVTEETKAAIIAMLQQNGVANAELLVEAQLAASRERAIYATETYTNATYEQIIAWMKEVEAGTIAHQALAELAVQKWLVNNAVIDLTTDIDQFLKLAESANASAASMERALKVKELMSEAEYHKSEAESIRDRTDVDYKFHINQYSSYLRKAQTLMNEPLEYDTPDLSGITVEFNGVSSAANSAKDDIESMYDAAKNGIEELIDYRKSMLEKDIENQKDALEEQIDALQDFYDEQREMLEDQYDEEEYLAEQHEKQKSVTDLKGELAMLANDDSAWAQRRKLELKEELSEAEDDLSELEKEHALDVTLDMLDDQQEAQERQLQDQIDALDKKLNDPHALYNQALTDIRNNTADLYQAMIGYNRKYGSGNDDDVRDMWNDAYESNEDYRNKTGSTYKGIELGNYAGYDATGVGKASSVSSTLRQGSNGDGVRALQHALNQLGYGNSGTRSLDGSFGSGTRSAVMAFQRANGLTVDGIVGMATKAKFKALGYATGTDNATPGWHELFEGDLDEYIFTSGDGSRYRMFSGLGDKVLNAGATDFLYQFANSGGSILTKMIADLFKSSGLSNISKPVQAIEVNAGNVIVEGNADMKTVSEIRRAQRENLNFVLKSLNSLNK